MTEDQFNELFDFVERAFENSHLPDRLKVVSQPFKNLSNHIMGHLGSDYEETKAGLRKLLEAKDCFVRAELWGDAPD